MGWRWLGALFPDSALSDRLSPACIFRQEEQLFPLGASELRPSWSPPVLRQPGLPLPLLWPPPYPSSQQFQIKVPLIFCGLSWGCVEEGLGAGRGWEPPGFRAFSRTAPLASCNGPSLCGSLGRPLIGALQSGCQCAPGLGSVRLCLAPPVLPPFPLQALLVFSSDLHFGGVSWMPCVTPYCFPSPSVGTHDPFPSPAPFPFPHCGSRPPGFAV